MDRTSPSIQIFRRLPEISPSLLTWTYILNKALQKPLRIGSDHPHLVCCVTWACLGLPVLRLEENGYVFCATSPLHKLSSLKLQAPKESVPSASSHLWSLDEQFARGQICGKNSHRTHQWIKVYTSSSCITQWQALFVVQLLISLPRAKP